MRGHLTEKTDVFAFGVVALEIVGGRPNCDPSLGEEMTYLLEWVRTLFFIPVSILPLATNVPSAFHFLIHDMFIVL